MTSSINIREILTDNTNLIEIYLLSKKNNNSISLESGLINKIKSTFKKTKQYSTVIYCRNNYNYLYDLTNDNQIVYSRIIENDKTINNKYLILAFNEIKLPTHLFACTNDIDYKYNNDLIEFKINNRITITIRNNDSCYITYKHNKDVDIDKIQENLNDIISKLN
jgi:hypothetical protein